MLKKYGLNDQQVNEALKKYGNNALSQPPRETFWDKLWDNFQDPIIRILIFALLVNVVFVYMGHGDWIETAGIFLAIILATFVATYSEYSAYDKILQAGGFISVRTNAVQDANNIPIPKADADVAMDAAACIGCGACAATCKNGSAMLFVAARVSSLAKLPQGRVEGARRAKAMVAKMDELGFGNCTNTGACQAECPKMISISHIARLNREFLSAKFED